MRCQLSVRAPELPMMNERVVPWTFFVITGEIPGSRNMPTFVGRPIMEIIRESATVPTSKANALERSSMLRYLGEIQRVTVVLEWSAVRVRQGRTTSTVPVHRDGSGAYVMY